jgi:hypothetical protein
VALGVIQAYHLAAAFAYVVFLVVLVYFKEIRKAEEILSQSGQVGTGVRGLWRHNQS